MGISYGTPLRALLQNTQIPVKAQDCAKAPNFPTHSLTSHETWIDRNLMLPNHYSMYYDNYKEYIQKKLTASKKEASSDIPAMSEHRVGLGRLSSLTRIQNALKAAHKLGKVISRENLIKRLNEYFENLAKSISIHQLPREMKIGADEVILSVKEKVFGILENYETTTKEMEGKSVVEITSVVGKGVNFQKEVTIPEIMVLLGKILEDTEDRVTERVIMRYLLDSMGLLDDLIPTDLDAVADIIRLAARAAEDGYTEAFQFHVLGDILGTASDGTLLLAREGEEIGTALNHYTKALEDFTNDLEYLTYIIRVEWAENTAKIIDDNAMLEGAGVHQIGALTKKDSSWRQIWDKLTANRFVKRTKQQLAIFKLLKHISDVKNTNKGIKYLVVKATDDWAKEGSGINFFVLNLMEGSEEEMFNEFQNMLDHISGWNSRNHRWTKGKNAGGDRIFEFDKQDLQRIYLAGGSKFGFKPTVWRNKQLELIEIMWRGIKENTDWSTALKRGSAGRTSPIASREIIEALAKLWKRTDRLISAIYLKLKKAKRYDSDSETLKIINELEAIYDLNGKGTKKTKGFIFDFYKKLFSEQPCRVTLRVNILTYLYQLIHNSDNKAFIDNAGELEIVVGKTEDGSLITKSLETLAREDMKKAEIIPELDIDTIPELIRQRIELWRKSGVAGVQNKKRNVPVEDLLGTTSSSMWGGISSEEMLAELAEIVTPVAAKQIKSIIARKTESGEDISSIALDYIDTMLAIKQSVDKTDNLAEGIAIIDKSKSISSGPLVNNRSSPGTSPIDHLVYVNKDEGVYMYINDKLFPVEKRTDGNYYLLPPHGSRIKTDTISGISFADGNPSMVVKATRKKSESGEFEYIRRKDGLKAGLGKGVGKSFNKMYDDLKKLSPAKRIIVNRNIGLLRTSDDKFELMLTLQIGESSNGTLGNAIDILLESSKKYRKVGELLQQAIRGLDELGLVDKAKISNEVFWIHKTKTDKKGAAVILDPGTLRRNFIAGLKRQKDLTVPEINLDEINEKTFLEVISNIALANKVPKTKIKTQFGSPN
ncbi:MAG: hypothetical protein ACE5OZ_11580 [Candidatus Heimdallarchaeota archaeon]